MNKHQSKLNMRSVLASMILASLFIMPSAQAEVLAKAETIIKIPMAVAPSTRPQTVAYHPVLMHYYVADGGLAPLGSATEQPISKSKIHAFNAKGEYVNTAGPGFDNRSIYYNPNSGQIETITYNVSSAVGFAPMTGIFGLVVGDTGEIKSSSTEVAQFNAAFGDAFTMPSYDAKHKRYYAKQQRSNKVFIVDPDKEEAVGEITLDLKAAGAKLDDVADSFIAFTGIKGEELVLLDVDHKAALVFNLKGKFVAKSALPKQLKLRAKNYYNGLGYANDMLFLYNESEGEFGTYYGLKVVK